MGVEADTSNPWMPAEMVCDIGCHQMIRSVYDPLVLPVEGNSWAPYLAESLTPNADHTVWTIKVRPGITFHDGTPLDGAAVADNLTRFKNGFLTGAYFSNVDSIAVNPTDPLAVDLRMKTPWVTFPAVLAISQVGYIASPTWMAAADADETLKLKPVGTGPFIAEDYKPNEYFKLKKNPSYWNQPYPYLDELEYRPIPDALNRRDALITGAINMLHSDNGEVISGFRDNPDYVQEEITTNTETGYTLLHVTQTLPDGTPSPLTDQRVRCALGYAYDQNAVNETIGQGVFPTANGPFPPGMVGHLDDTGYPQQQDMAKAQELIADYKQENPGPLNVHFATTNDETNLTVAQFRKQWWEEAGVDNVSIDQIDQGAFIVATLLGDFQCSRLAAAQRDRPRRPVHLVALVLRAAPGRARAQLRTDQGPRHRRGARRQPGRDRSSQEAGVRRRPSTGASRSSATTSGLTGTSGGSPTNPRSTAWRTSPCPEASSPSSVPASGAPSTSTRCGSSSDRSACLKGEATRRGREATACCATSANG